MCIGCINFSTSCLAIFKISDMDSVLHALLIDIAYAVSTTLVCHELLISLSNESENVFTRFL